MKNLIFRRGFTKNQYVGRLIKKRRGLGKFADLRGGLGKKVGKEVFQMILGAN